MCMPDGSPASARPDPAGTAREGSALATSPPTMLERELVPDIDSELRALGYVR
jgi:hypothetical protein